MRRDRKASFKSRHSWCISHHRWSPEVFSLLSSWWQRENLTLRSSRAGVPKKRDCSNWTDDNESLFLIVPGTDGGFPRPWASPSPLSSVKTCLRGGLHNPALNHTLLYQTFTSVESFQTFIHNVYNPNRGQYKALLQYIPFATSAYRIVFIFYIYVSKHIAF